MPAIPQISNPIANKGYSQNTLAGRQSSSGGEQFDIIQLTNPLESTSVSERDGGGKQGALLGQKDFLPMSVKLTKDPTMAVESLKQIINSDLLAIAKSNGYTELHGELDQLMKSIFLKPEGLVSEIMSQEKNTTLFGNDKFYDLLRILAGTGKQSNEDLKTAIGNMLKAINFANNRQEILDALSSNMKFLSHYFSPNKALSQDLQTLSERWASPDAAANFEQLKNETIFITHSVSDSLLNNERIQVLIPLIVHNLSRYNANKAVLNEYFSQLLTQVPGYMMREELTDAFEKLAQKLLGSAGAREAAEAYQTYKETGLPYASANSENVQNQLFSADSSHIGRESIAEYFGRVSEESPENINFDMEALGIPLKSFLLGKEGGADAIKKMLGLLLWNPQMMPMLEEEMSNIGDMSRLIEYLNDILRNMPDVPERQVFYEHLSEIISGMAEKGDFTPLERTEQAPNQNPADAAKESTLKQLIEFVEKNIDHAAIKTIHNYNASNLLQSLINAPGVFTPLAHYIIPLDVDGLKSFGELWVDSDEGNASARASGGNCKYHLFLTFEVEAAGRFEIDLYANGKDVNLSFFYPESFAERTGALLGKVGKIIAQTGYVTKEIRTGPLVKPHDLTQIFPDILERRTGFNVKA